MIIIIVVSKIYVIKNKFCTNMFFCLINAKFLQFKIFIYMLRQQKKKK